MKTMLALAIAFAGTASAQTFSSEASVTQTITDSGPRNGGSQPFFHNAQGTGNGSFASFAASDYSLAASGFQAGDDLDSLSFAITQSNAGFTTDGTLNFYVASASNDVSGLAYAGDDLLANPGGLLDVAFVGTAAYAQTADGDVDTFTFDFDGTLDGSAAELLIEAALLSGGQVRWVIAGVGNTAATYGGLANFDNVIEPTLSGAFSIPAPGSAALLALGGLVATRRR